MPRLNPDLLYKLPSDRSATVVTGVPFPDDWLPQLIQVIKDHLESAPTYNLDDRMNEHLGGASTYGMKEQIIEGLKVIYTVMMDVNSSKENKAAIAFKLVERAEHCTPGFHDGVNALVEGFDRPESMDALLYRIRHDIVSKTANQTTDEVHANNRFFTVAQFAGYGVRALNPNDVYTGHIPDEAIQDKLKAAFDRDYRLFNILSGIEEQIRSELLVLGYTGSHSDPDTLNKSLEFLTTLFKTAPAVIQQQEAEQRLVLLQQTYEQQVNAYMPARRARVRDLISTVEPKAQQEQFIDSVIRNNIPAPFRKRYETVLVKFDENAKNELAQIQQEAVQFFESLTSLTTQMNEERAHLVSPFLLTEQDETGINWNQIRQSIWDACRNKQYFILTEQEAAALNGLLDKNEPFKTEQGEDLNLSGADVVFLLTGKSLEDEKKQGMLRWYIRAAKDTLEEKTTRLMIIEKMSKQDLAIRSVLNELSVFIDQLKQAIELIHSCQAGQWDIVKLLLETGADLNETDSHGRTALIFASGAGQLDIVKILLDKGADVNKKDCYGQDALICASGAGQLDIVKALLDKGADVNKKDGYGQDALIFASSAGQLDIVKILLEKGADVNEKDSHGNTALFYASRAGQLDIVKMLLEKCADVNEKDRALIVASFLGQWNIVKLLLERGADVAAKDIYGNTALFYASRAGQWELVTLLLGISAQKAIERATLPLVSLVSPLFNSISERVLDIQTALLFLPAMNKIKSLLESGSALSADVLQCYQSLPKEKHAAFFDVIKEHLPALIQSMDDYETLRDYLDPEQRKLALHVFTLQGSIKRISEATTSQHAKAFVAALLSNDNERIKTQVDTLVAYAKQHQNHSLEIQPDVQLIDILSSLKPFWKDKLISALELPLALTSKEGINVGIERYIMDSTSRTTSAFKKTMRESQTTRGMAGETPDGGENELGH